MSRFTLVFEDYQPCNAKNPARIYFGHLSSAKELDSDYFYVKDGSAALGVLEYLGAHVIFHFGPETFEYEPDV